MGRNRIEHYTRRIEDILSSYMLPAMVWAKWGDVSHLPVRGTGTHIPEFELDLCVAQVRGRMRNL